VTDIDSKMNFSGGFVRDLFGNGSRTLPKKALFPNKTGRNPADKGLKRDQNTCLTVRKPIKNQFGTTE
jgi:hypothetical protein